MFMTGLMWVPIATLTVVITLTERNPNKTIYNCWDWPKLLTCKRTLTGPFRIDRFQWQG
jgi:hypothetical protein